MKTALITGITGQDGSYLARHLLGLGYRVVGTSRDPEGAMGGNLHRLGIASSVSLVLMDPLEFRSVLQAITSSGADEIYNLAGQSSVGRSFEQPVETLQSIGIATLNFLEAIRLYAPEVRFYNACSSECFGDIPDGRADESTPFRPRSPYAVAKTQAFWQINIYREAYGLFACSGILFNHESPLRHPRFVTRKIVDAAIRIANGSPERLRLGDIEVRRDWGWAPDYVDAMHRMIQLDSPQDFVIATGIEASLREFVAAVFTWLGLDWKSHVETDRSLFRPNELRRCVGDPTLARERLGWTARREWRQVVDAMLQQVATGAL